MKVSKVYAIFVCLVIPGLAGTIVFGNDNHQSELLLQQAQHKVLVEGDVESAIELCREIIATANGNRALAAKALVQMGQYYEKLGRNEAISAYERVLNEYSDQSESVQIAQRQISILRSPIGTGNQVSPVFSVVLDDRIAGTRIGNYQFSPDGKKIAFSSNGNICEFDLRTSAVRAIVENQEPEMEWLNSPKWSPDGKLIAYSFTRGGTKDSSETTEYRAIQIVNASDGTKIGGFPIDKSIRNITLRWIDNSEQVSIWNGEGLNFYDLNGKKINFIPKASFPGSPDTFLMYEFSPDGNWIAYNGNDKSEEINEPGIWMYSLGSGEAHRVVTFEQYRHSLTWSPDGKYVYYKDGNSVYRIQIDLVTGNPVGNPEKVTSFKGSQVFQPEILGGGSQMAFSISRRRTFLQVADAANPGSAISIGQNTTGTPEVSPDGQLIYFTKWWGDQKGIYSIPRDGGEATKLTEIVPSFSAFKRIYGGHGDVFDLSPDGKMLAFATDHEGKKSIVTLSTMTGELSLVVEIHDMEENKVGILPQWSPDGKSLAYVSGKNLYVIHGGNREPVILASLEQGWESYNIRWSPDGKHLAAFSGDNNLEPENSLMNAVHVIPVNGGKPRKLTTSDQYKEGLEWHPDGTRITYHLTSWDSDTRQVLMDGSQSLFHDEPDVWDWMGKWSPDGKQYVFKGAGYKFDGSRLFVYDESTGESRCITEAATNVGLPCWSKDGTTMAWWETRVSGNQIMVMDILP